MRQFLCEKVDNITSASVYFAKRTLMFGALESSHSKHCAPKFLTSQIPFFHFFQYNPDKNLPTLLIHKITPKLWIIDKSQSNGKSLTWELFHKSPTHHLAMPTLKLRHIILLLWYVKFFFSYTSTFPPPKVKVTPSYKNILKFYESCTKPKHC